MSHGATIALTNLNGETRSTRVNWASKLDQSLGIYLAGVSRDRGNLDSALQRLFCEITKYEEISSIAESLPNQGNIRENLPHGLRIENPRGINRRARLTTHPVVFENLKPEALAAHYDLRSPGYLTFSWIDPRENSLRSRRNSLTFLAHYYGKEDPRSRKLKRFGNLRD